MVSTKKILIHTLNHSHGKLFDINSRDSISDPFLYMRDRFKQLGYLLDTADNHSLLDCSWVIFDDISSVFPYGGFKGPFKKARDMIFKRNLFRDVYEECIKVGMQNRMALFLNEGPAVSTNNWNVKYHTMFKKIFTWKDDIVDNKKYFKFHIPQPLNYPVFTQVPYNDKKMLVNISMNKYSKHPRELYSFRREAIRYFETEHFDDFDLYGFGWDQSPVQFSIKHPLKREKYLSYRGTVTHKWEVLPYYKFSLCFENVEGENGYITEKIFDCMRCGCVPIYLGSPNIKKYVDPEAFIDRRDFNDNKELYKYIKNVSEQEYQCYQEAMRTYLLSTRFAKFLPPAYVDNIIQTLEIC